MFANFPRTRVQRRGVVLILVLGMLSLLALVGVTFATFSGQARVNARNFAQSQNWPDSSEMMDYALGQLINDTDNPQSAIRGHSLKRDMYGNDAIYNSYLSGRPGNGAFMMITGVGQVTSSSPITVQEVNGLHKIVDTFGLYRCITNIPANDPAFYGYNFTRWILRFPGTVTTGTPPVFNVAETHEVLVDTLSDPSGFRTFYIAPWDGSYTTPATGTYTTTPPTIQLTEPTTLETPTYFSLAPTIPYPLPTAFPASTSPPAPSPFYSSPEGPGQSTLIGLPLNVAFTLDGRYLHAFNGTGMSGGDWLLTGAQAFANRGLAQYANFKFNGNIVNGGLQQSPVVNTPSYGFPSNPVTVTPVSGHTFFTPSMDEDYDACDLENWFLALQSADGQITIPSFHRPGILMYQTNATGAVAYDDWQSIDAFAMSKILRPRAADGHNATAFPNLYPDANGKINYDVDNDGDGTTDSVWLDLGYPAKRNAQGQLFKPLFAFMVIGLNGRIPLNTAGNLQLRQIDGTPLSMHASGKGFSPSEIDPTYALQNAYDRKHPGLYIQVDNAGATTAGAYGAGTFVPGDGSGPTAAYPFNPPWGSSGVPASVTQLRNILAGMRSQGPGTNAVGQSNYDANWVVVNGQPVYFPNGVMDAGDIINSNGVVPTTTPPIAGRWGEANDMATQLAVPPIVPPLGGWMSIAPQPQVPIYTYANPVRAGLSGQWNVYATATKPGSSRYGDGRDDNHNTFDPYPANAIGATAPTNSSGVVITTLGENADYFDASGSLSLPVERIRRFLSPIDVAGDGMVLSYANPYPATIATSINSQAVPTLLGADRFGRVAYFKHFRPPGLIPASTPGLILPSPLPTSDPHTAPNAPPAAPMGYAGNSAPIWYPDPIISSTTYPNGPIGLPQNPDLTTNVYHGFESARDPSLTAVSGAKGLTPLLIAGMPSNVTPTSPAVVPTFDQNINTMLYPTTFASSPNLNEADEMNLYASSLTFDQAYGPSDLEWLYRQQDTDGVSLSSRLQYLAQISFTNPKDGIRRRRMFSTDSWEMTNFVLAHDAPLNDPQLNNVATMNNPLIKFNSRFPAIQTNYNTVPVVTGGVASMTSANFSNLTPTGATLASIPSLAHRDRKINLNYPLPVSNRYDEPVRQKWIRETYELLKQILPPAAVDTPEELAQLSQYVVNIIDFRDPDCTATRFVNTDIYYSAPPTAPSVGPPATPGQPATLSFTNTVAGAAGYPPILPNASLYGALNPTSGSTVPLPPAYSPLYDNNNSPYVVQYGMEYNPVAITEMLAFNYTNSGGSVTQRMWIELVNTLTAPATATAACDLSLDGWDIVILPDDNSGRPDPYTGQLPFQVPGSTFSTPLGITLGGYDITKLSTQTGSTPTANIDPGGLGNNDVGGGAAKNPVIKAMDAAGDWNPYVIDASVNSSADDNFTKTKGTAPSPSDKTLDLFNMTYMKNVAGATTAPHFYWLYLRRPANPFDTSYDPLRPNENRVVVDCFRFMYGNADGATADKQIYSLKRFQPFRGGCSVPPIPAVSGITGNDFCINAYGYTDQAAPSQQQTGDYKYQTKVNNGKGPWQIMESLGDSSNPEGDKYADFFPFNDRDFTSVAELLLVPGCPPGLFTKQFVEAAPPLTPDIVNALADPPKFMAGVTPIKYPLMFTDPAVAENNGATPNSTSRPHTFPYLMDEFFYTAQTEPMVFMADDGTTSGIPPGNLTMFPGDTSQAPGYFGIWPDRGKGPAPIKPNTWYPPAKNAKGETTAYANFPITTTDQVGTSPVNYYRSVPQNTTTTPVTPSTAQAVSYIGGPSSAGWYKMFEMFEVSSPANGSIGPVTQGSNYDWARQDLRPGLLNLNLIIDEEVFFSLMSETWLKTLNYTYSMTNNHAYDKLSPSQSDLDNMGDTRLNVAQLPLATPQVPNGSATPIVVSQVNMAGTPTAYFNMSNTGFTALDTIVNYPLLNTSSFATAPVFDNRMKAAFSDFLKLRHGGSGYMFAYQYGNVGDPNPTPTTPISSTVAPAFTTFVAAERPFRSLSYPDINMTVMRPASLPPTSSTVLTPYLPSFTSWLNCYWPPNTTTTQMPFNTYIGDPGVKNPYLFTQNDPCQSPPIPPRRLFEVPDVYGYLGFPQTMTLPTFPMTKMPPWDHGGNPQPYPAVPSPASSVTSTYMDVSGKTTVSLTGDPEINWLNQSPLGWTGGPTTFTSFSTLSNPSIDLVAVPTIPSNSAGDVVSPQYLLPSGSPITYPVASGTTPPPYLAPFAIVPNFYLGANSTVGTPDINDNRQHPYYRYEWLQKVTNLTTVRTHQFAVWITVGFFEVTKEGDASLGTGAQWAQSYDRLGQEVNIQNGRNIRYRSFFIIDRTRAVGFSPQTPGNFRDCVVYRQAIE